MEITLLKGILIFISGLIGGFINTIAGSGSLITLPLLVLLGLDISIANGTNRIAILFQTLTGIFTFRKEKLLDTKLALHLSIPIVVGAVCGTLLAANLTTGSLEKSLGFVFLLISIVIILNPDRWNKKTQLTYSGKVNFLHYFIFFLIGVYGGFIQAGVGIFLLFALVSLLDLDVLKANALKLLLTFIFTPLSILIFWKYHLIDWKVGLILASGSMTGAYLSAKIAIRLGTVYVKWFIVASVVFSGIYFLLFK